MTEDIKRSVKIGSLTLFFIFIALYAIFGSHDLLTGVRIKNVYLNKTNGVVEVTGNAKNAVKLTLNGREISIDEAGNFEETLVLLLGYNPINIRAVDKFGNEDEINYELLK
jgi:hypothetical protein